MTRLQNKFSQIKKEGRAALITYIMAYAPDNETSFDVLCGLPEAGADIIELGMPFSDPMADGPIIQEAANIALGQGAKIANVLEMASFFRKNDKETPIILMGYYNPILNYGVDRFAKDAQLAGIDGLLIVDLPPEEENLLKSAVEKESLAWIRLATPTTDDARLRTIIKSASGFIYYVSVAGITGTISASYESISDNVSRIKKYTDLPVAVGFGIKSSSDVNSVAKSADAVVVGSAIVKDMLKNKNARSTLALVKELASGL